MLIRQARNNTRMVVSALLPTLVAAGLAFVAAGVEARQATAGPPGEPNRVDIKYVPPKSADHQMLYTLLKERQGLEKLREFLSPLRLPHRLLLETTGCDGMAEGFSNDESIIVCYEYLQEIWRNAPAKTTPSGIARIDTLLGPFVDVFLHEAGHATFSMLQIPIFGREEDAADQFSTYLMLTLEKDEARRLILGSAYQYKGDLSSPETLEDFADVHDTPAQRFFNLLCIAYGFDPKLFADVVKKQFLPEERAVGCKREYVQLSYAFDTLIGPHIDKELASKLHRRWLPPITEQ